MILHMAFRGDELFRDIPVTLVDSVKVMFGDVVSTVTDLIRAATPVDTGELVGSWEAKIGEDRVSWETDIPYAPIVEFGGYKGVGPKTKAVGNRIYSAWVADNKPAGIVTYVAADKQLHEDILDLIVDEFLRQVPAEVQ